MEMLLDNVEIEKQIKKLDVLNRKPFVDQVFKVIELLAKQKRNACFAINGVWGVGKSYTLDMLEKKLKGEQDGETASDKYAVFHYNCWQYDYYAEPIVAIVAAMLDVIEANDTILPKEYKAKIKGFLKVIGTGLLNKAGNIVEEYTGVDVNKFVNIIREGNEKAAEEIDKEHAFDYNFLFKKALERFRDMIKKISDKKTVIFIVDELDRCLPEYGIKVLERLHHMFEEIPNVQVILSIDKTQLEHIVEQTFGENTNTDKSLGKFINFEIDLDEGEMNEYAEERFNYYYSKFEPVVPNITVEDVTEIKNILYIGVGIRSWINIIDKCQLLHSMLYPEDKKMDLSFLCIELFLTVAKYSGIDFGKDFSGSLWGNFENYTGSSMCSRQFGDVYQDFATEQEIAEIQEFLNKVENNGFVQINFDEDHANGLRLKKILNAMPNGGESLMNINWTEEELKEVGVRNNQLHKYDVSKLNEFFYKKLGLKINEIKNLNAEGMTYSAKYNAYYTNFGDTDYSQVEITECTKDYNGGIFYVKGKCAEKVFETELLKTDDGFYEIYTNINRG